MFNGQWNHMGELETFVPGDASYYRKRAVELMFEAMEMLKKSEECQD
jgi:hypothetical protein